MTTESHNIGGYVRIWAPHPIVGPYIEGFEYYARLIDTSVYFYLGAATSSISLCTLYQAIALLHEELRNASPCEPSNALSSTDAYLVIAPSDDDTVGVDAMREGTRGRVWLVTDHGRLQMTIHGEEKEGE